MNRIGLKKWICLSIYYGFARYLPISYSRFGGKQSRWIRYQLCKRIFLKCGINVNIERMAYFHFGQEVEIGDNSGIGINCTILSNTKIGKEVMMGPNCYFLASNHVFERTDIPMRYQGLSNKKSLITIGDDVWIGRNVTIVGSREIKNGTIIGACTLLCKNFPEYSIVGGNPSKLIRNRKENHD